MDLDAKFGVCRFPKKESDGTYRRYEVGKTPKSKTAIVTGELDQTLKSYILAMRTPILYDAFIRSLVIWTVDASGQLFYSFEEFSEEFDSKLTCVASLNLKYISGIKCLKLGHPTLLNFEEARATGELAIAPPEDKSVDAYINGRSGRYCRGDKTRVPTVRQLQNVADLFSSAVGLRFKARL
ncbi:hypothetical protein [Donghicola eburneus]|uniref:Uncharacterized protein n=1 Tax=Donghicola eburneus TaxID=393278 RepID=A0A1M4MWE6_9RHOB|nr:hypothetical protein [Donghicola eburneus]SCM66842.1 hypothetical protein KARMA_1024 [Donghicola eburneus]